MGVYVLKNLEIRIYVRWLDLCLCPEIIVTDFIRGQLEPFNFGAVLEEV